MGKFPYQMKLVKKCQSKSRRKNYNFCQFILILPSGFLWGFQPWDSHRNEKCIFHFKTLIKDFLEQRGFKFFKLHTNLNWWTSSLVILKLWSNKISCVADQNIYLFVSRAISKSLISHTIIPHILSFLFILSVLRYQSNKL